MDQMYETDFVANQKIRSISDLEISHDYFKIKILKAN